MIEHRTWYVVAFFLLGVAAAVWLNQSEAQLGADATGTPAPAPLWQLAPEAVLEIEVRRSEDEARIHARRAEEVGWELLVPESEEQSVDPGRLERAVTALLVPRPVDVLQDVNLADFGLDPPAYQVTLTLQDGSTRQLMIGRTAPTGDVTYATMPGEQVVYLLPAPSMQEVIDLIERLPVSTPMPESSPGVTPGAD